MKTLYTLAIILIISLAAHAVEFAGGNGTAENPFLVASADHLNNVRIYPDMHFLQTHDIDLATAPYNLGWTPIGGNGTEVKFTGHYNGNNKEIRNLVINRGGIANVGLFGHIGNTGNGSTTISNVKLVNASVTGGVGTGTLAGRVTGNQKTRIENCSATGTVSGDGSTGGLVGSNNSYHSNNGAAEGFRPVIYACWTHVSVELRPNAPTDKMRKFGGIAGCNMKGLISNSYARGTVNIPHESAERIGGLAGCVEFRGIINNSYATGDVTVHASVSSAGGLLGNQGEGFNMGTINDSYYSGTLSRPDNGLGTRRTAEQLKNAATLATIYPNWDFTLLWTLNASLNNGFPSLNTTPAPATHWFWVGTAAVNPTRWDQDGNWVNHNGIPMAGSPAASDDVTITSSPNQPTLSSAHIRISSLTLETDAVLNIAEASSLTITGTITTATTLPLPRITGQGVLIIGGSLPQEIPQLVVNNITVSNYNNVHLAGTLTVNGLLLMEHGLLDLNGFCIELGSTGSLFETDALNYSSRVYGTSGTINASRTKDNINDANLGLELYFATGDNPGVITLRRGHSELAGSGTSKSIMRWFDISPENNYNLDATLIFKYFAGDLTGVNESSFSLFKRPVGSGPNDWVYINATLDAYNREFTAYNLESFSQWTASNGQTPLPIKLFSFEARPLGNLVELFWITASEVNNDYFTLERSHDGISFNEIGTLPGSGTISSMTRYFFTDEQPLDGTSYYRLKQTDYDGSSTYSPVIALHNPTLRSQKAVNVYPNPSSGSFNIQIMGDEPTPFRVTDISGRVVYTGVAYPGSINQFSPPSLAQGMYNIVFQSGELGSRKLYVK